MKLRLFRAFAIVFLILSLLNPKTSVAGASAGLVLWFQTIVPTLLPFIILSNILVSSGCVKYFRRLLEPFISGIFHKSGSCAYAVVVGLLCGYPMGAKAAADLVESGQISKKEGQWLISFCNLPSPMFLIGFVAVNHIAAAVYLPVLVLALLSGAFYKTSAKETKKPLLEQTPKKAPTLMYIFESSIMDGLELIAKIGGYIILFSILSAYIQTVPFAHQLPKGILLGTIEITTGIHYASGMACSAKLKAILCTGISVFGGCSGLAQTNSVMNKAGFSLLHYTGWKLCHVLLSCVLMYFLW